MLDKLPSSAKNVELLGLLYREIMDASRNPQAATELSDSPEVAKIPGLKDRIVQAAASPKAMIALAMELDAKSKQLFERPKATEPANPKNPTETKDNPVKSDAPQATYFDQYGHVVDSPVAKESK